MTACYTSIIESCLTHKKFTAWTVKFTVWTVNFFCWERERVANTTLPAVVLYVAVVIRRVWVRADAGAIPIVIQVPSTRRRQYSFTTERVLQTCENDVFWRQQTQEIGWRQQWRRWCRRRQEEEHGQESLLDGFLQQIGRILSGKHFPLVDSTYPILSSAVFVGCSIIRSAFVRTSSFHSRNTSIVTCQRKKIWNFIVGYDDNVVNGRRIYVLTV